MAEQNVYIPWEGWKCVRPIGKGGFGTVYEIERVQHGITEKAAMKRISIPQSTDEVDNLRIEGYDDESITQRFSGFAEDIIREYGMMVQMKGCANIVYCDDYKIIQSDDGFGWDIYIKMELLTPLIRALGQVSAEEQIIRFGLDICNALEVCQKRNVIHRDIKPQNIFVSDDGVFKLGDFGIARTAERTTRATVGVGTYQFMAPEVKNDQPYGATVDLYSLGLVMYWLLNSRRMPFLPLPPAVPKHSEEEQAKQRRFAGERIPAPRDGSEALKRIVLKACAFNPKDRYQSAREMREELLRLSGGYVPVLQPEPVPDPEPDFDEAETVGPIFGRASGNATVAEEKTVGPVFKSKTAETMEVSGKTIGQDLTTKAKNEKSNTRKPIIWIACLLSMVIFAVALIIGSTNRNENNNQSQDNFLLAINRNMTDVVANEHLGAAIDDAGQLWVWNAEDMTSIQTPVNNVAGLAVPTIEIGGFDAIYFVGIDGALGFIQYDDANKTFGQATYVEAPVPIIDVEAYGMVVYALGKDGCLYQYNVEKSLSPTKIDTALSLADLQIFEIWLPDGFSESTFVARGNDGEYYGWGYNVFGKWCDVEEANIASPVKLSLPSGLQSAYFFKRCGTNELMCAAWREDQTVAIIDNQGITTVDLAPCTALYAGTTMVYMVQGNDLLAYGRFASGHKLDENTSIFSADFPVDDGYNSRMYVAEGFGAQIKSFSAGGQVVVMLSTDDHVRTWGGRSSDRFLKNADGSDFVLAQSTVGDEDLLIASPIDLRGHLASGAYYVSFDPMFYYSFQVIVDHNHHMYLINQGTSNQNGNIVCDTGISNVASVYVGYEFDASYDCNMPKLYYLTTAKEIWTAKMIPGEKWEIQTPERYGEWADVRQIYISSSMLPGLAILMDNGDLYVGPHKIPVADVVDVQCFFDSIMFRTADGTFYVAGKNSYGSFVETSAETIPYTQPERLLIPTDVDDACVVRVIDNGQQKFRVAILEEGTLSIQDKPGNYLEEGFSDVRTIEVADTTLYISREDGTMYGFADDGIGRIAEFDGMNKIMGFAPNEWGCLAVDCDGAVRIRGTIYSGPLYKENGEQFFFAYPERKIVKVVAGAYQNIALYSDGTVKSSGVNYHGEGDVEAWCDIIDVCATEYISVGLKSDGTVVATGYNEDGQCNVSGWTDMTAIAASGYNVIGVKRDGTVEAIGNNDYGQCNVDSWTGITQADIGTTHAVGLRADGTVVATGDNEYGQCNVSEWTDIVSVKVAYLRTIGLKADGTVVATGGNFDGECDVSSWTDIIAIDTDGNHTVGLKSNGTVVTAGLNSWESFGACDVGEWTDIVYVEVGYYRTIGLKSDGTIVATGDNDRGQCDIGELGLE